MAEQGIFFVVAYNHQMLMTWLMNWMTMLTLESLMNLKVVRAKVVAVVHFEVAFAVLILVLSILYCYSLLLTAVDF